MELYDLLQALKSKGCFFNVTLKDNVISFLKDKEKYAISLGEDTHTVFKNGKLVGSFYILGLYRYFDLKEDAKPMEYLQLTGDTVHKSPYICRDIKIPKEYIGDYVSIALKCLSVYSIISIDYAVSNGDSIGFTCLGKSYKMYMKITIQGDRKFSISDANYATVVSCDFSDRVPSEYCIYLFVNEFIEYLYLRERMNINGILNDIKESVENDSGL